MSEDTNNVYIKVSFKNGKNESVDAVSVDNETDYNKTRCLDHNGEIVAEYDTCDVTGWKRVIVPKAPRLKRM